jgi:methionyl aminopeptidase
MSSGLIKTPAQIDALREGGRLLSGILGELVAMVAPGVTTGDLDQHAQRRMKEVGAEPSFLGYRPEGVTTPFASAVCISLNHEVIHAPAYPSRPAKAGDLIKLDIGMWYKGMCTDMAVTVPVGGRAAISEAEQKLLDVTKQSLLDGVAKVRAGGWVSDIGKAVDKTVRRAGFTTVKDFCGHGVGHAVHEDPQVPNFFDPYVEPLQLREGMVIAIEPMVNVGGEDIDMLGDEWTVVTEDGSRSAHFEVTVAVTANGYEVLTPLPV